MKYLPRNRVKNAHLRKAALLATLFFLGAGIFTIFDSLIISVISPLWRAENSISRTLGKSVDFFRTRNSLIYENTSLKERVSSLELEVSALALNRDERETLLALLERRGDRAGIAAAVLTHPPQSPYDFIIIDAGVRDFVDVGARVSLPEGQEVGVVEDAAERFSRVKLFSTPGENTPAVLERNQVPVTLEGTGAGNFRIVVPRDTAVEIGDRVLSPNLDSALLAVVEEVSLEATDSFKEILARSPANIFSVRFLTIRP